MGASRENVTSNNSILYSQCILDAFKPTNVFLCGAKKQRVGVVKRGAYEGRGNGLISSGNVAE